jgi:hypothetical protein
MLSAQAINQQRRFTFLVRHSLCCINPRLFAQNRCGFLYLRQPILPGSRDKAQSAWACLRLCPLILHGYRRGACENPADGVVGPEQRVTLPCALPVGFSLSASSMRIKGHSLVINDGYCFTAKARVSLLQCKNCHLRLVAPRASMIFSVWKCVWVC